MDERGGGEARGDLSTVMSISVQVMPGPIGQSIFHGVVLPMAGKHLNDSFTSPSLQYVLMGQLYIPTVSRQKKCEP
jgi:hypothetical protein